jgi:hypothetical protein
MQSFLKLAKDWGYTALGLLVTTVILALTLYVGYLSRMSTPSLQASDHNALSAQAPVDTEEAVTTKPTRVIAPSIDLALDIDDASIDITKNAWPLSDTNAQYANFTPQLGSKTGTMLIYGHNTWPVMRKTSDLKMGDKIAIVDQDGKTWQFQLEKEEIVVPENVGFIYEDVPFRIVIFTCNGWNDEFRRLMFFEPVS